MKKALLKILRILKNYYVLATLFFVVWVGFIDTDNLVGQYKQQKEMNQLLDQQEFYTDSIEKMKKLSAELTTNMEAIERYGRETYQMKKDYEDVFLIEMPATVKE
ncbi:MAG TPA: hypothetical protein PKW80_06755 [Bacteroidales bacterium]|nr:hypothetical protein [Bacteroidales bacterium]